MFGFFLIEVLLAILLISFGLLPLLQSELQISSKIRHLYYHDCALYLGIGIVHRFKANPDRHYRLMEEYLWRKDLSEQLPNGRGSIFCAEKICQIKICWKRKVPQCLSLEMPL